MDTSPDEWSSRNGLSDVGTACTRRQAGPLSGDAIAVVLPPGWVRTDMGGSNARFSTEKSVSGMLDVIAGLTPDDSGRFLSYDGEELPW